jgi:putative oxidoreductase
MAAITQAANSRSSEVGRGRRALNIGLWAAQVVGAALFLMAGSSKLFGAPMMVAEFEHIGLGQWFRYFTGGTELIGAILLVVPRFSGVGGLVLVAAMIGALLVHAVIGGSPVPALVLLALVLFVSWGRRDRTIALVRRWLGSR